MEREELRPEHCPTLPISVKRIGNHVRVGFINRGGNFSAYNRFTADEIVELQHMLGQALVDMANKPTAVTRVAS